MMNPSIKQLLTLFVSMCALVQVEGEQVQSSQPDHFTREVVPQSTQPDLFRNLAKALVSRISPDEAVFEENPRVALFPILGPEGNSSRGSEHYQRSLASVCTAAGLRPVRLPRLAEQLKSLRGGLTSCGPEADFPTLLQHLGIDFGITGDFRFVGGDIWEVELRAYAATTNKPLSTSSIQGDKSVRGDNPWREIYQFFRNAPQGELFGKSAQASVPSAEDTFALGNLLGFALRQAGRLDLGDDTETIALEVLFSRKLNPAIADFVQSEIEDAYRVDCIAKEDLKDEAESFDTSAPSAKNAGGVTTAMEALDLAAFVSVQIKARDGRLEADVRVWTAETESLKKVGTATVNASLAPGMERLDSGDPVFDVQEILAERIGQWIEKLDEKTLEAMQESGIELHPLFTPRTGPFYQLCSRINAVLAQEQADIDSKISSGDAEGMKLSDAKRSADFPVQIDLSTPERNLTHTYATWEKAFDCLKTHYGTMMDLHRELRLTSQVLEGVPTVLESIRASTVTSDAAYSQVENMRLDRRSTETFGTQKDAAVFLDTISRLHLETELSLTKRSANLKIRLFGYVDGRLVDMNKKTFRLKEDDAAPFLELFRDSDQGNAAPDDQRGMIRNGLFDQLVKLLMDC